MQHDVSVTVLGDLGRLAARADLVMKDGRPRILALRVLGSRRPAAIDCTIAVYWCYAWKGRRLWLSIGIFRRLSGSFP